MRSFEEDKQRARQVHSGLVKHGQFMPSQFGAKPTMANTGLDLMMKATALRQAQQQEFQLQQHLRRMEREHKANRFLNAERVMAGKPPILPRVPRLPLSTGPFIGHNLRDYNAVDWQNGRYVSSMIWPIFDKTGGWGNYYGVGGFGTSNKLAGQGVFLPDARGRSTDTVPNDVKNHNLYVNPIGQFRFKNIPISDRDFINYMLGNLISGQGPENYVFPENGVVSERAAKGETFKKAIDQWYTNNESAITRRRNKDLKPGDFKVEYGPIEQLNGLSRDGTPITIPNFIASA